MARSAIHRHWLVWFTSLFIATALASTAQADDAARLSELESQVARLYSEGKYAEAIPLAEEAVILAEKVHGLDHPETAITLNTLARLYQLQGRYREAEPLYTRALAIRETLGPENYDTALSLNDLALLYQTQGRFAEAEPLYRRALAITEKHWGPEGGETGSSLNNLGMLYWSQGRYAEAEALYKRALAIREKAQQPEQNPATAYSLNNLAVLYEAQGRYAEAEPLHKRALAIFERAQGQEHPNTATSLSNLAWLYQLQSRHVEAEPLYKRALAISEKVLGAEHPSTALSLNNLAGLYQRQGRYRESERHYRRALAIREKVLGPQHPETGTSFNNLALLRRATGRWGEAVGHLQFGEPAAGLRRACAIYDKSAAISRPNTPADRSLAARTSSKCDSLLIDSLHRWSTSGGGNDPSDNPAALRAEALGVAQRVGAKPTSAAFARGAAHATAKRQGAGELAQRWEDLQNQIDASDKNFNAAAGGEGSDTPQVLANLNAERGRLNAELARAEAELRTKAPDFFDLIKPEPVSVEDLQARTGERANILRPDEAIVLLVPGHESKDKALQRESLILVVSKTKVGWAALPKIIAIPEMGLSFTVEEAINSLHADLESAVKKSTRDSLVSYNLDIAHALYKALFASSDEIRAVLDDPAIKTWVIAPQGIFLSLPYASLVMDDPTGRDSTKPDALHQTKWLGIERTLTIVPSVSSLAVQRLKLSPKSRIVAGRSTRPEFLGFGDPDFARAGESRDTCPPASEGERSETPVLDRLYQGVNTNPKSVRELKRLPGTCHEVKSLGQAFKAPKGNIVLGLGASEPGVRKHPRLAQARIIAFATHGLIAGSLQNTLAQPALAFTPPPLVQDQLPPIEDDGLLTTTDAASLDLQADWVLLSACNTAAKEGNDPDGLSGLARAFFYAGARSLLVSHWPVHDEAGMRLTTKAVALQAKDPSLTRPQAFRLSMQALLHDTSDTRFAHPAFWAPFFIVSPE